MINPFDNEYESLVHIASGAVAPPIVQEDMNKMLVHGEQAVLKFMTENLLGDAPNIYTNIKKSNIKTFRNISKKVKIKNAKNEIIAVKDTKKLFAQMILLAKSRDVDIKEVLQY